MARAKRDEFDRNALLSDREIERVVEKINTSSRGTGSTSTSNT